MSHPSGRSRFATENLVRSLATIAMLFVVGSFGAFAPVPSLAASELAATPETTDNHYSLKVSMFPTTDGNVRMVITISTPSSAIWTTEATVPEGQSSSFEARQGDRTLKVDIPVVSSGQTASLEVWDGKGVQQRVSATIQTSGTIAPSAEPISVNLKDADLKEFLKTLAEITGREIRLDPGITGKVSINVVDMPWDIALDRAIAPLGLEVMPEGEALRIFARGSRYTAPPPPPGYETVGGDVKAPVVISRVAPTYPLEARTQRVAGIVITQLLIDETGTVKDVQIVKDLPYGLGQAAADAVRRWKFKPATRAGKPVPVVFNLTVNFKLDTTNAPPQ